MTRTRIAVIIAASAALALSGCGAAPALPDVDAELVALDAAGLAEEVDGTTPAPSASAVDQQRVRPRAIRKHLRRNTLHGEVTVQTRDGVRVVVVQRGTITTVSETGMTVESTDGFESTWTYGDQLRLVKDRKPAEKSVLTTGVQVGVAGVRDGDVTKARLIVVR